MHLLATTSASLDDVVEAVDLRQTPADIAILSFADSDLSGLAAAWTAQRDLLPTVRLANLRDLRHPFSVDLWLDTVGRHAKVVVVRLLGGLDWWRYGIERLSSLARESSIALALLPGEDRDDPRLVEASTVPAHELETLLRFFREGGPENLAALLRRLARHAGSLVETPEPRAVPAFIRAALARLEPAVVVTTTAFAATAAADEPTPFDGSDMPVLQAVIATTRRSAWTQSPRGLGPADLAMHVVLPELDGRVLQGVIAFKGPLPTQAELCFSAFGSVPEADRIAILADRVAALVKLQAKPRAERRVAVLLPDYPGVQGRGGYAVGLDVPASVISLLSDMETADYAIAGGPTPSRALLDALLEPASEAVLSLDVYRDLMGMFAGEAIERIQAAWGDPQDDADVQD